MKERLLQPALHQGFVHLPLQRPASALIKVAAAAAEVLSCEIEQGVGGPAVPAQNIGMAVWAAGWRNQREIGDSTEVEKSSGKFPRCRACVKAKVKGRKRESQQDELQLEGESTEPQATSTAALGR